MVISIMLILSLLGGYFFYQSRDLVRTPLLEPFGHDTPHGEPFFLLVLGSFAEKSSPESLDSSLGLDS